MGGADVTSRMSVRRANASQVAMSGGRFPGERCSGMDQDKKIKKEPDDVPMARGWPLLVLGVAISFAALVIALRSERLRIDEDAGRNVDLQVDELERGIQRYASILTALRVFFESSDEVDPAEFDHFTTQLVALGPGVQAVEWIPSISGPEERRVLEQKMKKTEPGFSVRRRRTCWESQIGLNTTTRQRAAATRPETVA